MPSKAHLTRSHSNSKSRAKNDWRRREARRDFSSLIARVVTIRCIYMRWFFYGPIPRSRLYRSSLLIFLFARRKPSKPVLFSIFSPFVVHHKKTNNGSSSSSSSSSSSFAFFLGSFTSSSPSPLPLSSLRRSPVVLVVVSFVSPVPSAARPILQRPARVRATDTFPTPSAQIVSPI